MPFDYTDYYTEEMGEKLLRKLISFEKLVEPLELIETKIFTNSLEEKFLHAENQGRQINLDPGYITAAKLVLASTKDHVHRIYLGRGIYAEVTLKREGKTFRSWLWTYPDYGSDGHIAIFNEIRRMYMAQLREAGIPPHAT